MLHVTPLGEQSITDDVTGSVRMHSSRTVALVAFLALHAGSPQARQRIAGLFWPDSTDAQALTNLRRELHNLHPRLKPEQIEKKFLPVARFAAENEKPAGTAGLRRTLPLLENLERAKGFEPSTPTLARSCSTLSYTRIREIGGDRSPATGRAMPNAALECNSRARPRELAG